MSVRQLTFEDAPEQRKAAGQSRIVARNRDWLASVLPFVRAFLSTFPDGATVTADDWREVLPSDPPHPNILGGLAGVLARWGWIEWTGEYTTSKQPQGNQNVIKRWRVNRAAVLRGPTKKKEAAA